MRTIFVGGGTPTVLPPALLAGALDACREAFDVAADAEITSEANPGTVDQAHFAALAALGVNRLSMGVQSFDDAELAWLQRIHSAGEAEAAFAAARRAGFANINLDFMFGLPGQELATWARTLARAVSLRPEHLSLYGLTVEHGTPLFDQVRRGLIAEPDDDLAADFYLAACETLAAAGYEQYEISNWARRRDQGSGIRSQESGVRGQESDAAAPSPHLLRTQLQLPASNFQLPASNFQLPTSSFQLPVPSQPRLLAPRTLPRLRRGRTQLCGGPPLVERQAGAGVHPPDRRRPLAGAGRRDHRPPAGDGRDDDARPAAGGRGGDGRRASGSGSAWGWRRRSGPRSTGWPAAGLLERLPDRVRLTPGGRLLGNQVFAEFLPG